MVAEESESPLDYRFKIIVAGNGGVGKTTLLKRYVDGTFISSTKMTIALEFHQKVIKINNKTTELLLWDFGGQTHFRALLDKFVDGANGALLMFDLTRLKTLLDLDEWIEILKKYDSKIPIILIGGKADLLGDNYLLEEEKVLNYAKRTNMAGFLKTSSKTGENVQEAFEELVRIILKK